MSYQVLARKWRPQTFAAVVGQDPITRTLRNALVSGRIAHAYLFAGPRGVGKTTTARLLAKALLCAERTGPEPCGQCEACHEVQAGSAVDVIEIDAASNRGIDEIRALRENARYAAARGRSKVYIIDEAHMLTEPAFNALLKTLEEPPAHVVFVLATTEARRIPPTILSRCQRFDFKPIPPEALMASLEQVLREEQVSFDADALRMLALAAEGSLRDALSLLDTALAYSGGWLEGEALARLLGSSAPERVRAFVAALVARNGANALEVIDAAVREGEDLGGFCRDVVEGVRQLLVLKVAPGIAAVGRLAPAETEGLRALTGGVVEEELLFLLRVFLEADGELRRSPHPRVELEIAAVRGTRRPVPASIESVLARVEEAEARLWRTGVLGASQPKREAIQESLLPVEAPPPARSPALGRPHADPPPSPSAPPETGEGLEARWQQVVEGVMQQKPTLGAVLQQSLPVALRDGQLTVSLVGNHFHADLLDDRANRELITQLVQRLIPGATRLDISAGASGGIGTRQHPVVQAALELFGGEIVGVRPRTPEGGATS
ncbi:MAG: DNA polymerase III subunit gamma/tau [Candidatus Methylomirabilia bacterium]